MWKKMIVIVVFAVVCIVGCDECDSGATRCNGEQAEICNMDGIWELSADCADVDDFGLDIEWKCCVDPEDGLHSCLPVEDCGGESDGGD